VIPALVAGLPELTTMSVNVLLAGKFVRAVLIVLAINARFRRLVNVNVVVGLAIRLRIVVLLWIARVIAERIRLLLLPEELIRKYTVNVQDVGLIVTETDQ
jgi:hypothetical protein